MISLDDLKKLDWPEVFFIILFIVPTSFILLDTFVFHWVDWDNPCLCLASPPGEYCYTHCGVKRPNEILNGIWDWVTGNIWSLIPILLGIIVLYLALVLAPLNF